MTAAYVVSGESETSVVLGFPTNTPANTGKAELIIDSNVPPLDDLKATTPKRIKANNSNKITNVIIKNLIISSILSPNTFKELWPYVSLIYVRASLNSKYKIIGLNAIRINKLPCLFSALRLSSF